LALFLIPERREADLHNKRYVRVYKTLIIKGTDRKCKLSSSGVVGQFEISGVQRFSVSFELFSLLSAEGFTATSADVVACMSV
jgi:hypothetical protein